MKSTTKTTKTMKHQANFYTMALSILIFASFMLPPFGGIEGGFAQAPPRFNYQGIARDNVGNELMNQAISLRISILKGSPFGTESYKEIHDTITNEFGLFTVRVGGGALVTGQIDTISWGSDEYFLKVEMNLTGDTNYQFMGTSQLLSVPYALYADSAGAAPGSSPQTLSLSPSGDTLFISNGNNVPLPATASSDTSLYSYDAGYADTAGYSYDAGYADTAGYSYDAGYADTAGYSYDAGYANTATYADTAWFAYTDADADWTIDADTLYSAPDSTVTIKGGNVGIGTTEPGAPLDVRYVDGGNIITIGGGIAQVGAFGFEIGSITYLSANSAGYSLGFRAGASATDQMRLTSTGNVGIGTATPGAKLEVAGQVKITGGAPGPNKVLTSDAGGLATWQAPVGASDNDWTIDADTLYSAADSTVTIKGGKVGIGTPSPSSQFHLKGNGLLGGVTTLVEQPNSNSSANLFLQTSGGPTDRLKLVKNGSTIGGTLAGVNLNNLSEVITLGNGALIIGTTSPNHLHVITGNQERLRIDSIGNVGIGTTSPSQKLDVAGTAQMIGFKLTTAPTIGYVLTSDATGVGTWQPAGSGSGWSLTGNLGTNSGTNYFGTADNVSLRVRTNNVARMVVDSTGNVGIGTTLPGALLHLYNNTRPQLLIEQISGPGGAALDLKGYNNSGSLTWRLSTDVGVPGDFGIRRSTTTGGTPTTDVMTFDPAGNLGIGTTSPANPFQLHTATDVNLAFRTGISDTTGPLIQTYNDAVTANVPLGFRATKFYFEGGTGSGNVGIGTTTPGQKLEVAGNVKITSNGQALQIDNAVGASGHIAMIKTGDLNPSVRLIHSNFPARDFTIETGDGSGATAERLRITTTGNVGIGTTSPSGKFHVNNDVVGSDSSLVVLPSGNVGIGTTSPSYRLDIINNNNGLYGLRTVSTSNIANIEGIYGEANGNSGGTKTAIHGLAQGTGLGWNIGLYGEALGTGTGEKYGIFAHSSSTGNEPHYGGYFQTTGTTLSANKYGVYADVQGAGATNYGVYSNVTGATNNYSGIFMGGNVGIGTTAPSYPLHVQKSAASIFAASIENQDATGWGLEVMTADVSATRNALEVRTGGISRFLVRNDGKVGIGTTGPVSKLQVAGDVGLGDGTPLNNEPVVVYLTNGSGGVRVKGEIVIAGGGPNSFNVNGIADNPSAIGVVYDASILAGAVGRIAIAGVAQVKASTLTAIGDHVLTSATPGSAGSVAAPGGAQVAGSIGVWLESVAATNLGRVLLR